jgi:hypothetical protein
MKIQRMIASVVLGLGLMAAPGAFAQGKAKPKPAADAKAKPAKKADHKAKPDLKTPTAKKTKDAKKAAKDKAAKKKVGKVEITWLGHAAFQVVSPEGTVLLIDPFLSGNPATPAANKDLSKYSPAAILVTHSHMDHLGDTVAIAKTSKAKVIGDFGFVSTLKVPDDQKMAGNVGGKFVVGDATIHLVPAMHGSAPGGRPLGFVIEFAKKRARRSTTRATPGSLAT